MWVESGLYGTSTTGQILDAGQMKQSLEVHVTMSQTISDIYCDVFYNVYADVQNDAGLKGLLDQAIQTGAKGKSDLKKVFTKLMEKVKTSLLVKMKKCDARMEADLPLFKFIRQYMRMVSALLLFLRATHNGLCDASLATRLFS